MSLTFYMGASGSGKSYRLYQDIIEKSLQNPHMKYLIVVPDQFTMQTQKDICLKHPNKGIMNIDVLSFGRLSHRIFEEVGKGNKTILDDTGKNLILRKVAQEKEKELQILGKQLKKIGYIHEVKSSISEFMQYGIGMEELNQLIQFSKKQGVLSYKLEDLKILYQGFLEYLSGKYMTTEETLILLKDKLKESNIIKGSVVVFDGFTGFTPVQDSVIREIMNLATEVIVALTIDKPNNWYGPCAEQNLFYLSEKTIQKLENIAIMDSIERNRQEDIILETKPVIRYQTNPELAHLEQQLFRQPVKYYEKKCTNISVLEFQTLEEEIRHTCIAIKKFVREQGYKYQEIAVVTGDLSSLSHLLKRLFKEYEIPCFMDQNKGILLNPFIEYIKSAIETIAKGFTYETVFHFLRSGMTGISIEEIDKLENYILAFGIKGKKRWHENFTRRSQDMNVEFAEELESLNRTREAVVGILSPLLKKGKTVREVTKNLYEFMTTSDLQDKLFLLEEMFQKQKDMTAAKEYAQVYRFVIDLLDQMVALLGDDTLSLQEYAEVLYAGFDEIQVGIIPQSVDQVVIGDIERTRLKEIKALFFIGITDGIIPKSGGSGGIISDMEREFLKETEFELAPSPRQQMYRQRLYLYMSMTKPKEYLYLSYAKGNGEGKSQRPSYLIAMILKLFPKLILQKKKEEMLENILATPEDSMNYLSEMIREYAAGNVAIQRDFFTLYAWYERQGEYRDTLEQLKQAAFYHYENSPLGKAVAEVMYGKLLENSVSRLEQYAACAYSHFLKYGLELYERAEFSFERVDMGNVFHSVMERFTEKLEKSQFTWFDFPKEIGAVFLQETLDAYAAEYGENILYSSARNEYFITRMKRILLRTIDTLQYQLKKGVFKPSYFELSFSVMQDLESVSIALSSEEKMKLRGRIDRVDTYEDANNVYVKVIDYKSGNVSFDLLSLYHGLQLQLVVYMNAAVELERKKHPDKKILPAAILYYHMDDPFIQTEGKKMSDEEINQSILEKLRMNGIIQASREVVEKLDTSFAGKSDIIPVEYKKDGSYSATSSVMAEENITGISQYVNHKIKEIGREILNGNIEVNPYELGNKSACTYCQYKAVCGFDRKILGYQTRRLDSMTKEEAMEKIMKNAENGVVK